MKSRLPLFILISFCFILNSAAEDILVEGTAVKDFHRIGAWGWEMSVESVMNGPPELQGKTISVYLTSANPEEYPPGFLDPNIKSGDKVEAFGKIESSETESDYSILLVGSAKYYLKTVN
jgi:hypothetical protein